MPAISFTYYSVSKFHSIMFTSHTPVPDSFIYLWFIILLWFSLLSLSSEPLTCWSQPSPSAGPHGCKRSCGRWEIIPTWTTLRQMFLSTNGALLWSKYSIMHYCVVLILAYFAKLVNIASISALQAYPVLITKMGSTRVTIGTLWLAKIPLKHTLQ